MTQGEVFPDEKNIILKKYCQYCKIFFPFQKPVPFNLWRRLAKIVTIQVKGMQSKYFKIVKRQTFDADQN